MTRLSRSFVLNSDNCNDSYSKVGRAHLFSNYHLGLSFSTLEGVGGIAGRVNFTVTDSQGQREIYRQGKT